MFSAFRRQGGYYDKSISANKTCLEGRRVEAPISNAEMMKRPMADRSARERSFVLRIIQPGLAGLMDGSVSTLAPIFATAFATNQSHTTFLVGMAAAVGAGISMAFSEGLSDDGTLTGRGNPIVRGLVTGAMTFLGGVMHTLPFLIGAVHTALTFAYLVVGIELLAIAYIRYHFFKMNFFLSCLQVIVGGVLVFVAGVKIGSS
jgi:erythrin-vacuolar iron transport family protein